jgi:hypothetical protein
MSIRVTCTGCHTRFNVSEKFAGREGPCPKCKKPIKIPAASEEVKVHAPEEYGPKGAEGRAVLKPVFRTDTSLSPVQIVLIGATIFLMLAVAVLFRLGVADKDTISAVLLLALGVIVAVPCTIAGYMVLRDPELGTLSGQDLMVRAGAVAGTYGLSWLSFFVANSALIDNYGTSTHVVGLAMMFAVGTAMCALFLELDVVKSLVHAGFYIVVCLVLRGIAGLDVLPTGTAPPVEEPELAFVITNILGVLLCF